VITFSDEEGDPVDLTGDEEEEATELAIGEAEKDDWQEVPEAPEE